jgi:UDP-N-acetylmuramate--alanine ligase
MAEKHKKVFLCGVGGSGMSALALILVAQGYDVAGSDRAYDEGQTPEKFEQLRKAGIVLAPQDGSGVDSSFDILIVSSAVEDTVPDVAAAKKNQVHIEKRADVLARLFNAQRGIAVGGTSGKSTVTAMIGHVLQTQGMDPTIINGAPMVNAVENGAAGLGNTVVGASDRMVIEADESDGTIAFYKPDISILTNISLDHKPISETLPLFRDFLAKASTGAVVNVDNADAASLKDANARTITFSLKDKSANLYASDITHTPDGVQFNVSESGAAYSIPVKLRVPGAHNVENAMAAIGAARLAGVPLVNIVKALADFKGVKRRLEVLGQEDGVTVIDDFGHNPDKIAASLAALGQADGRLLIVFQPHGFGPMRLMGKEIAKSFADGMDAEDILVLPEILYKGGTVTRDISSADTVRDVNNAGRRAEFIPEREDIGKWLLREAKPGDRIIVMGARDDSLTDFARSLLTGLGTRGRQSSPKAPDAPEI